MISYKISVLESCTHSVVMHGSIFGCLLNHKEAKRYQMGFQMGSTCWCLAVWLLKDLIAIESVFLASFNIASFPPLYLTACKCNGHASVCNTNTGKCFCTTKGIKGDECQLWVRFSCLFKVKDHARPTMGPQRFLMIIRLCHSSVLTELRARRFLCNMTNAFSVMLVEIM